MNMGQLHKKEPTGKNANTKESPVGWAGLSKKKSNNTEHKITGNISLPASIFISLNNSMSSL